VQRDKGEERSGKSIVKRGDEKEPGTRRTHWRFEDLEIWQLASDLAVKFHNVAAEFDRRRLYRYAEQLRGAGLSLSNNIAEGAGSTHKQEFIQYLNIARRSLFEDASMLLVFEKLTIVNPEQVAGLLTDCDILARKITNFSRSL
jgi:four helix bundle protein